MIDFLIRSDHELFLLLNRHHTAFFDFVFLWCSSRVLWIPFYAFILYMLYRSNPKVIAPLLISVGLLILFSDQISVMLFKNIFHRLRPCHRAELNNLIHVVGGCGGEYGFISSHAANSAALTTFLILSFGKEFPWFRIALPLWAFILCYSRVYCGVHFPGDVVAGAIVGCVLAFPLYLMYRALTHSQFFSTKN